MKNMTAKKLGQSNILSLEANAFKRKQVTVTASGEEFTVAIDEKFKDTEVAKVFAELVKRSDYAKKASLDFDITAFILILLIKHFTDIHFQETNSTAQNMDIEVRTLNALINLGLFEQIIEHFDKAEVEKLGEMFKKHEAGIKIMTNNMMVKELGIYDEATEEDAQSDVKEAE